MTSQRRRLLKFLYDTALSTAIPLRLGAPGAWPIGGGKPEPR